MFLLEPNETRNERKGEGFGDPTVYRFCATESYRSFHLIRKTLTRKSPRDMVWENVRYRMLCCFWFNILRLRDLTIFLSFFFPHSSLYCCSFFLKKETISLSTLDSHGDAKYQRVSLQKRREEPPLGKLIIVRDTLVLGN